ncbi:MAG: YkgJ family cysteine cluster protein [Chthoniobacterales bacterium]
MIQQKADKIAANETAAASDKNSHAQSHSRGDTLTATRKVYYQCQRCTNCCKWPGEVKLTNRDIKQISAFLGLDEQEFINHHTRLQSSRQGLALLDKPNGECAFLDGRDCAIQPVKPHQCSGFPNTWNFPGWRDICEAIEVAV